MNSYLRGFGTHVKPEPIEEAVKKGNYYTIGGDRYDMGVVFAAYVDGKKVADQILDGDDDFVYKKKKYNYIDKVMDAIAKDHGLRSHKDFKRIEESFDERDMIEVEAEVLEEGMKMTVKDFGAKLTKEVNKRVAMVKKNAGHDRVQLNDKQSKALDKHIMGIAEILQTVALEA